MYFERYTDKGGANIICTVKDLQNKYLNDKKKPPSHHILFVSITAPRSVLHFRDTMTIILRSPTGCHLNYVLEVVVEKIK